MMEGERTSSTPKLSITPVNLLASAVASSLIVKVTSGVIFIFYLCSFSSVLFNHLCVTPGYVLPPNFWIWTLITHSFLQSHILLALIDILVVFYTGMFLEPVYKPLKLGLFFAIVTIFSALSTSVVYIFLYYVNGNTDYIFETRIHGLGAYIGGLSVAVKQLMPDQVLLPLPWGKLQNKHMPFVLLLTSITLAIIGLQQPSYTIQFGFGMVTSWIYLRFYQKHENGNSGDMADEFSFSNFFPGPLRLPVAIISNTVFSLLVRVKLCKKPQRKYDVSSPTTITVSLPGTDPADAERRRQLAIKALNDRLNATTDSDLGEESHWPGLVDEEEAPTVEIKDETTSNKAVTGPSREVADNFSGDTRVEKSAASTTTS